MQTPGIKSGKIPSRNLHTLKYETFLGNFDPDKKPIINIPLPDPSDESYTAKIKEMKDEVIGVFLLAVIVPYVFTKYPDLYDEYKSLESQFKMFLKAVGEFFVPITDNRWDRSMCEWVEIISYAKDYGYRAASRKFFAIKDGKQKYLSPNYIKQKAKAINKHYRLLENSKKVKEFKGWLLKVHETVINDNELRNKGNELYRQHFNDLSNEVLENREAYSYDYYYIRHYDPDLYKKQKSNIKKGKIKKTQVTGKIECDLFKVGLVKDVTYKTVTNISTDLVRFMRKREDHP